MLEKLDSPVNDFQPSFKPNEMESPNFNIDDLVKRIDAKIAELEAEEAAGLKKESEPIEKLENTVYEKFDDFLGNSTQSEEASEPVINIDQDSVVVSDNNITDDQFYDDFFPEE